MLRRLFTVTSALSLLLCIAAVVLWVRSYRVGDAFSLSTRRSLYSVTACRGRMWFGWRASSQEPSFYHAPVRPPHQILTPADLLGGLGFFYDDRRSANGDARLSVVFPVWLAALVAGLLPAGNANDHFYNLLDQDFSVFWFQFR